MRNILLFEDYIYYGSKYGRYGRIPFSQTEDPDKLTTGIMGKDHVVKADDIQFDPEKVRQIIKDDPWALTVASQVMSANFPDMTGALGDVDDDGLRVIFDNVIVPNYKLRQAYEGLPDKNVPEQNNKNKTINNE